MAGPSFYLNVLLLNKDELVSNKVTEKAGSGLFGKAVSAVATRVVTDELVLSKLGDVLTEKVQSAVEAMGIQVSLERCYAQGPVVCFKVTVKSIDQLELVLAAKGADYAASFSRLLVTLTELGLTEVLPKVDEKIATKVTEGMMKRMEEMIPEKTAEQGLEVQVKACLAGEQAEVFFSWISKYK